MFAMVWHSLTMFNHWSDGLEADYHEDSADVRFFQQQNIEGFIVSPSKMGVLTHQLIVTM